MLAGAGKRLDGEGAGQKDSSNVFLNHRQPGRNIYDYKTKGLNSQKYERFTQEVLIKFLRERPAVQDVAAMIKARDDLEKRRIEEAKKHGAGVQRVFFE